MSNEKRFFFTATDEQAEFIYTNCERLGLLPYEFLRMVLTQYIKSTKKKKKA